MKSDELELTAQLTAEYVRKRSEVLRLWNEQGHRMTVIVKLQRARQKVVIINELNGWHVDGN